MDSSDHFHAFNPRRPEGGSVEECQKHSGNMFTCIWMSQLAQKSSVCFVPFSDFEMKKDIDTLIAEERAEIINKYEKASYILSVVYLMTFWSC